MTHGSQFHLAPDRLSGTSAVCIAEIRNGVADDRGAIGGTCFAGWTNIQVELMNITHKNKTRIEKDKIDCAGCR